MVKATTGFSASLDDSLNSVQAAAVRHVDGPLLIHAGAGSGKTRVLTYRVAYLVSHAGVKPWEILAVTFTNKAATEMKERILALTNSAGRDIWIGTFHSICAKILRMESEKIGYQRNFLIFDRDDQLRFLKFVMRESNISEKEYPPNAILSAIGGAKNHFVRPSEYRKIAKEPFEETVALVYATYQKLMKANNTMDFDDLLINPIYVFEESPATLSRYQDKFRHILVDEYQDTNKTQYLLLKKLAAKSQNLCVVGDDDQSIYRWRGADITNILNMENDYPDCQVYRLEQNYRSTKNILEVANSVVQNNVRRREKRLWTNNSAGEKVSITDLEDHTTEAQFVVRAIKKELTQKGRNFGDFVVLYRTNSQSRVLEDALTSNGIPYVIVGGVRFYERKEIKDVLSYLRLICNSKDGISFKRVINTPLRGIGETSVARLEEFAKINSLTLFEAGERVEEVESISPRIRKSISSFVDLINKYSGLRDEFSPAELARAVVEELGILRTFKEIATEESMGRYDNVCELLSAITNYRQEENGGLEIFLEEISLVTDIDRWDDRSNAVTLMTIHSAKGLEFPVVFMTGLEEGLFPLTRSFNSNEELEEERRLFYVGATRAREKLCLTWASRRLRFGEFFQNMPSRFIDEISPHLIERNKLKRSTRGRDGRRGERSKARDTQQAMPAYEDFSQEVQQLYVGSEVKHGKFGIGRVTSVQGAGEGMKVTVLFRDVGQKKLLVKYANLEVLG